MHLSEILNITYTHDPKTCSHIGCSCHIIEHIRRSLIGEISCSSIGCPCHKLKGFLNMMKIEVLPKV